MTKLSVFSSQVGDVTMQFDTAGNQLSSQAVQGGSATTPGFVRTGGNASVQVVAAGQGNAAATTDTVLFTYALPASALDVAGRQVTVVAAGTLGSTANNKRFKLWWGTTTQTVGSAVAGGTLMADSGVQTTNGGGWSISAQVSKYGAAGSNTQIATNQQAISGTTHLGTAAPVLLTANESNVINITVTGASTTTGAANDVLGQLFDVAFNN
ncbi:hypothetical protein [Paraburkholderia unamae]|uniref:Bacteriophage lambda head decoration protein D n=1 Tax=Paraburkholderia unamae TaxID=219649 RepID=A0ABX5K8Q0_9BURK|nr:hypothetical protein [Paraburkholderia unamae]PVX61239.1 hypothetical protein C7402_14230 [Paraburkholderia unamae]